ncbi:MAG: 4Fe-4S binding protein [Muribaculaceae bacterium]|nr:4Fe-4S binding protein [Muribaculaceae bacterium]
MNDLKTIRIFLTTIFLVASLAWLFIGPEVNPMAVISVKTQIIPSALTVTIGATAFWLVATFVFGRLYCSSVCPVGTLQDAAIWLRRFVKTRDGKRRTLLGFKISPLGYRHRSKRGWTIFVLYVASLIVGILRLEWLLQPWTLLQSAAGLVRPGAVADTWGTQTVWGLLGSGVITGCVVSAIFLAVLLFMALLDGRWFCNEICPIGTGLGFVGEYSLYHIEIDPDRCTNCMKCEEVCPSHCVKVVSRYVDDARCVRCFNCLKVCPDAAIRYQINRNRRQTPLMQRRKQLQ